MNLLAPFGFFGAGNIGDEATLQGFAELVARSPRRFHVWVGSQNPHHTRRVEPRFRYFDAVNRDWRRRWAAYRASAVVFAGGTPVMDCLGPWPLCEVAPLVEQADRLGKPAVFLGVGTERLHRQESRQVLRDQLADRVGHWSVRSSRDEARLIDYGVPAERITVAADLAWLLEPTGPGWGRRHLQEWGLADRTRLLGVNLLGEKAVLEREPRLFGKMAAFLDELVENHGVFVLFLANEIRGGETFDTVAAQRTVAAMKHCRQAFVAPNDYLAPQQMCSLIANCHTTVSMRYHFCLFSALQSVPFLALKRSDKVADLCEDMDWPFGTDLTDLQADELAALYGAAEGRRAEAIQWLQARVPMLRVRAAGNMSVLSSLSGRRLAHAG